MVGGRISRRSVRAQIGWMECLFDTLGRERKRGGEGKGRIKKELDRMERRKMENEKPRWYGEYRLRWYYLP